MVASLTAITKQVIDTGDALAKMSVKTGVAVEDLSKLEYAAGLSGVSMEQLEKGLVSLGQQIGAAGAGNAEAAAKFESLGVSVRDSAGKLRPTIDVFYAVADAISALPEGAAQTNAAIDIFGAKVGRDLVVALAGGSEAIKTMGQELADLGGVMSTELAKASEEFNDNLSKLAKLSSAAGISIANALLPSLNKMLGSLLDLKTSGVNLGDLLLGQDFKTLTADAATRLKSVETRLASLREQQKTARDGAAADIQKEIERQERLAKFFGQQVARDPSADSTAADEALAAKREKIAAALSRKLIEWDKLRGIASGKVSAEILQDDKTRTAEQIANAEKLRDALRNAWQASIDGAKKAREDAKDLLDKADEIRQSGAEKAADIRRAQLPEADQQVLNQRDSVTSWPIRKPVPPPPNAPPTHRPPPKKRAPRSRKSRPKTWKTPRKRKPPRSPNSTSKSPTCRPKPHQSRCKRTSPRQPEKSPPCRRSSTRCRTKRSLLRSTKRPALAKRSTLKRKASRVVATPAMAANGIRPALFTAASGSRLKKSSGSRAHSLFLSASTGWECVRCRDMPTAAWWGVSLCRASARRRRQRLPPPSMRRWCFPGWAAIRQPWTPTISRNSVPT